MNAPPAIETARLLLSRPESRHAEPIFERYASDPAVTRFLGWPRHQSIADTRTFLAFSATQWEQWPAGPYLIWSREGGALLGGTGFGFETADEALTGYVLARDAWGKGYATEALTAIVGLAPAIGVRRLSALCHAEHRVSQRVLEKCGFAPVRTSSLEIVFPNLEPATPQAACRYEIHF